MTTIEDIARRLLQVLCCNTEEARNAIVPVLRAIHQQEPLENIEVTLLRWIADGTWDRNELD